VSNKLSEVPIQARAPAELGAALEREAQRRMTSKSAIIRWALVQALGLDPTAIGGQAGEREQEARLC
jgi:hypothetical protein